MKTIIKDDLFGIVNRLKKIDRDYFVLFNHKNNKYELHNKAQLGNTYCLTFPYKTLDYRAITHTLKTSVRNCEKIFYEIDKVNESIEKSAHNKILDECEYKLKDIISFADKSSKSLNFNQIHKNKWI